MILIHGMEIPSDEYADALIRHLEMIGDEAFEKTYLINGEIRAGIFAIVGPNSEEMAGLFREWMHTKGFKRTT